MNFNNQIDRILRISAVITIIGILFSGPVGVLIVSMLHPQPLWHDAEVFANYYHRVQTLPFIFGFFMMIGFVLFISAIIRLADTEIKKIYGTMAVIYTSAYVVTIGLNYVIQAVYIPEIIEGNTELAGLLTMVNPSSFSWILEMFGYGFLGAAGWLVAPIFEGNNRMKSIRYLLIVNGIISVLGAIITAVDVEWVLSTSGLISYVVWNLLIIIVMILIFLEFKIKKS
ncbi:MAG: hypothetical protein K9G67_14435 [Bacteroidales bacterium]|nr:hypothetical protein [Bacteroidales bacterium]MCF8377552.1 hypothetical protein [Bacteroidales bacterium]MCF8401782.1 hypothetical protein [Bacteroidales bacterium]